VVCRGLVHGNRVQDMALPENEGHGLDRLRKVKRVVEACGWRAEGELGEGVVRLIGGRRTRGAI
jgi:hypothetical protein